MENYCVRGTYTIKEVMEKFDDNNERCAIVLNNDNKVIGVVSQGDIVRALTAGINIYAQVETIIKPSFLYIQGNDINTAYKIFKKTKITLLPVVDHSFYLVGVITLDDIYEFLESKNRG